MARYTTTPWRHPTDLLSVRDQLYSSSTDSRRYAVSRVQAWKLRGNLPHAVESTALLVDAILHHASARSSNTNGTTPTISDFSLRAVCTAAFTRFVTGFCDIGRSREGRLEPSSMLDIARQIDMPGDFVALRHEATHEEMPGLRRLVEATERALEWLWRVYWSRLAEAEVVRDSEADLTSTREEVKKALRNYRSAKRAALQGRREQIGDFKAVVDECREKCQKLCAGPKRKQQVFAEVLVESKLLLPSNRELGSSMEGAFQIWDNLLMSLCAAYDNFLTALVKRLVESVSDISVRDSEHNTNQEGWYFWLLHLLDEDADLRQTIQRHRISDEVMKWCCLYPSYWTAKLGREHLLGNGEDTFEADWQALFEASQGGAEGNAKAKQLRGETVPMEEDDDASASKGHPPQADRMMDAVGGWRRAALAPTVPIGVLS